jgi:cytochrome oxidase assembly protein ShyY1
MVIVALVCVGAGTWQIARFDGKVHANDDLRANVRARPVAAASLLATTAEHNAPTGAVQYRTVTAAGRYDAAHQALLRREQQGGLNGYDVITPLRTGGAVLLVDRGFLPADSSGDPPVMPAPPTRAVTVRVRVQPASTRSDAAGAGQIESVNPAQQARRLGAPVYRDYGELLAGEPGSAGVHPKPPPSLSNPAGGAVEPQHFAYIIQWYLFALLALAAPFAMIRADRRDQARNVDQDDAAGPTPQEERAARLADRYGRALRS